MTALKIDKEKRQITATLILKGEQEPIQVVLQDYTLATSGEQGTLTFKEVSVSREWMAVLAREHLIGRALPLPRLAVQALMLVM